MVVFVVDAREGVTAVDSEVAKLLRKAGKPVLRRRQQGRQRQGGGGRRARPSRSASRRVPGLGQPRPRRQRAARRGRRGAPARAAARQAAPATRRARSRRGRAAARPTPDGDRRGRRERLAAEPPRPSASPSSASPTSASRRSSTACSARSACWSTTRPGRRAIRSTPPFSFGGREYVLVDTAGMRRRRSIDTLTEHVAAKMARDQLERCDVAALVVDAREGATAEDARLASLIEDSGRGALVVLNKKDLVGRAEIDSAIETTREALAFMRYAPVLVTSAVTRAGVTDIVTEATRVLRRGVAARLDRRAQQAVRGDRRPPAAARRPRRPPRPSLLRHPGRASARRPSSSARTTPPTSASPTGAS